MRRSPNALSARARKLIRAIAPYASWSQLPEGRVISAVQQQKAAMA
ncbi:hypothetical protein [Streptomyces sp. NPDC088180]